MTHDKNPDYLDIMDKQSMKLNFNRFKEDSERLESLYKSLVKQIPIQYMLNYLKSKKLIKRNWEFKNE